MIQIRKEENQKKQKEKKLKVYKVNTHKKTVIALWVLLAVSFLFAVYKNFTAIDIHTVHETKVIEEQILDTHKIENFVENFAEVYYSWEQSAASIDSRTNALKGYLTGELQALNVDTVRKDIPVSSALTDFQQMNQARRISPGRADQDALTPDSRSGWRRLNANFEGSRTVQ